MVKFEDQRGDDRQPFLQYEACAGVHGMHTVMVVLGGFVMLAAFMVAASVLNATKAKAALWFVPAWLIGAGLNMWVGVAYAGYTVAQEFPIFLAVFGIPAAAALLLRWHYSRLAMDEPGA
jgi:hypothetical protein